ncbi:hypothetical protein PENSTE_c012G04829 [Penicillium steckii]|uniref:IucC family-domain-containing protein n=1 Tax=Penicillium steckii TaxID=303698 RepID=A0A1V6T4N5_9EURO|nr:hypothetical protein PENSTE_c012G04829 [Penicillium steckii]
MTVFPHQNEANLEATKRLLAEVVNEGLVSATVESLDSSEERFLVLSSNSEHAQRPNTNRIRVNLRPDTHICLRDGQVISLVRPNSLQPPVILSDDNGTDVKTTLQPETIFDAMRPWLLDDGADEPMLEEIGKELANSCNNQVEWLQIARSSKPLGLNSQSLDWERALITGHPTHPYHRLCYAQAPLKPFHSKDLADMLTPSLAFVSVPRSDMLISGEYEETLESLLQKLKVPKPSSERLIVPCLTQQLPAVQLYFPNAIVVKTVSQIADALASIRTLKTRPERDFPYHIKLSLACQITSALRTITPWTAIGGPFFSDLLEKFLPETLWVYREVGAITGSQEDFSKAKHLSCILRDDLEAQAKANNEMLVLAAALAHHLPGTSQSYAEILFNLKTPQDKREWLQRYVDCVFRAVLPSLVDYGIGVEAHGQNLVARVCRETGEVKGFAVRDFGGIRLHVPTLKQKGVDFSSIPSGSAVMTDNLHNVWSKVHHAVVQNHIGSLLGALGLDEPSGWTIVRDTLSAVLRPEKSVPGKEVYDFFLGDTMPFKCFLRMRMEGKYRDYVEREIPNVLLMGSSQWDDILANYKPVLHRL